MSLETVNNTSASLAAKTQQSVEQKAPNEQPVNAVNPKGDDRYPANAQEAKQVFNESLLKTMFADSADKGQGKAQHILYQEAVSQIEAILQKEFGDESFTLAGLAEKTSGLEGQADYWSPENTADRIVAGATAHFDTFKKQNSNLSEEEQINKFVDIIAEAADKGIGEAVDILKGFEIFDGDIKNNALSTQELVQEKLQAFREQMLERLNPAEPVEQPTAEKQLGLE